MSQLQTFLAHAADLSPHWTVLARFTVYAILLAFAARTAFTVLMRLFGLSHPNHYHRWPRFPWRSLWIPVLRFKEWRDEVFRMGRKATGGFTSAAGMFSLMYSPGKVLLGRAYLWGFGLLQPVGTKVSRHAFMVAMTGVGKTVMLISQVALWRGSVFLIDPKAQVTNALRRVARKTWLVLDPFHLTDAATACWNWFDEVRAVMERNGTDAAVRMAMKCAASLVITPAGDRSPFFPNSARAFALSLLLFIIRYVPPERQNFLTFRALLNRGLDGETSDRGEAMDLLLYAMVECTDFGGAIANGAAALKNAGEETRGNVLATLRQQSSWLDLPELRPILTGKSSFVTSELKTRSDLVVALVAPVGAIRGELAPFCRLLVNGICHSFETTP